MTLPSWLRGILSVFIGSSDGETKVGASVSIPFGGPDPGTPEQPKEIPADVKARGWSKDINDCHKRIRTAWPLVKADWEARHPGWSLKCDYSYRSPEFQFELYKKGRHLDGDKWVLNDPVHKAGVVTDKDGTNPSHHNVYPSQAVDAYIVNPQKQIVWENKALYEELGNLWVQRGLISGAVWKYNWKDPPHVQLEYSII